MAKLVKLTITRWLDSAGRQVPKGTPGSVPAKEQSKKWYAVGVQGWPAGKRMPLSSHKPTAKESLDKLEEKAIAERLGTISPAEVFKEHNARALTEHLDAYRREMNSRGGTAKHVAQICARITAIADGCRFAEIADIKAEAVVDWLAARRKDDTSPALPAGRDGFPPGEVAKLLRITYQGLNKLAKRAGVAATGTGRARRYDRGAVEKLLARSDRGASVQTSNFYLAAIKGFCRWLVNNGRLSRNPLAGLRRGNVRLDRRHDRRELALDELARLLAAARESSATFRGMTGEDRFHLYLTAVGTGLRSGELASLRPEAFAFGQDAGTVTLPPSATKNRKAATQPLPPNVATTLRPYVGRRPAGQPIWPGTWNEKGADMLRIDLAAAGIPYEVPGPSGPLFADFHALRHSFITLLARSGVNPKEAQRLARHGDIRLTMDRYTHLGLADLTAAVNRLPAIGPLTGEAAPAAELVTITAEEFATFKALLAAARTGSGEISCTKVALNLQHRGHSPGRIGIAAVNKPAKIGDVSDDRLNT